MKIKFDLILYDGLLERGHKYNFGLSFLLSTYSFLCTVFEIFPIYMHFSVLTVQCFNHFFSAEVINGPLVRKLDHFDLK